MTHQDYFGEVIESSLEYCKVQSWQWDHFPVFGSLVTIQADRVLYGLIYAVQTGSSDPSRTPFPYQKTKEELLQEQPYIFEFLSTFSTCLLIGYEEEGKIYYQRVPHPPPIHAFMRYADKEQIIKFFQEDLYITLLKGVMSDIHFDELLLVQLKSLEKLQFLTAQRLLHFINNFLFCINHDYKRLRIFLQRLQAALPVGGLQKLIDSLDSIPI